jgi:hypothetical protein
LGKTYVLEARQIRSLAPGRGACIASDKITVHGERVGYMYRELPVETTDSGWRFLSGTETDEYMNDPNNSGLFDVNTIANYDTEIIEFLDAQIGAAFVRQTPGAPLRPYYIDSPDFVDEPEFTAAPATAHSIPETTPVSSAAQAVQTRPASVRRDITLDWSMSLEPTFLGRLVEGDLQFVDPGPPVRTIWVSVWAMPPEPTSNESPEALLAEFRAEANPEAVHTFDEPGAELAERRFATWYPEFVEGVEQWSLYGYTVRPEGWVQSAFIAEGPNELEWAVETWRSLRYTPQT